MSKHEDKRGEYAASKGARIKDVRVCGSCKGKGVDEKGKTCSTCHGGGVVPSTNSDGER
jgi:DnaJ-class molecular chaperone